MIQTLAYFPGQKVTVFLETTNVLNIRTDSVSLPSVQRVIFPDFTLASGYPANMIKLDTGLYYHQFTLPTGAVSVGSYLVDVSYISPATSQEVKQIYQVTVTAPYGNFSASVG